MTDPADKTHQTQATNERAKLSGFIDDQRRAAFLAAYDDAMSHLPDPEWRRDVETSFGMVRAYQFGSGVGIPMVVLPGKSASTPMWKKNLPSLMVIRPVICLDILGEPGLSVQTRPIRTAGDQAQWLAEALAALGLPRVHMFGVSFGGWSALNYAVRYPERVVSLVTLDPVNTFARFGFKVILFSVMAMSWMPRSVRQRSLKWISGGVENIQDFPEGRLIAAGMHGFSGRLPMPVYPSDDDLRRLTMPTHVVIAGKSIIHNPRKAAARAKKLLPNATVELWPDASHSLNGEFPDRIADRVRSLLRNLG